MRCCGVDERERGREELGIDGRGVETGDREDGT